MAYDRRLLQYHMSLPKITCWNHYSNHFSEFINSAKPLAFSYSYIYNRDL
uniref:Uncharacterized protein n=1 Tax=Utricularia reniformis TaxID=192314 RepID=A0A1Y0B105_9LAMI|nr:hypothetical protein AEK19_MT0920 [Utricularia reniformis]ART31146.1 hypothetical protein AEK19_MT0920 [Utricularia reniformis]